jgi:hypothetical protein
MMMFGDREGGLESPVEVRVNGECALIQGGAGASPAEVMHCVRAWADATGRTVSSVAVDGVEVKEEDLEGWEDGKDPSLLEIRVDVVGIDLRRASALVPGLRLDKGFAARCLTEGQIQEGLEALAQAIAAMGAVESALEGRNEGALGGLKGLLQRIHEAMQEGDLDSIAFYLREEGPEIVMECDRRIRASLEVSDHSLE